MVPTVDTIKIDNIIGIHFDNFRNVYLTGSSGTGKTALAINSVRNFKTSKNIDGYKMNFSSRTSACSVQEYIVGSLFFLSQKSRGASFGRKNVVFIDDVGMPEKEYYGARPPIEMARQIIDLRFVYEKKEKTKISIQDTCFFCLGAIPEGGNHELTL